MQSNIHEPKRSFEFNGHKNVPAPVVQSSSTITTSSKPSVSNGLNNDNQLNENLTAMITEQRRQNRLLEQVIAAINTSNALLTQLVQR